MLLFLWQIPKPSLHSDKKPHDRTDSLAQKWGWTALPQITTHILPTGRVPFLFYPSYCDTCGLDMDFYSRHITMFTITERNPIHADTPQSPKPTAKSLLQSCSSARGASPQPSLTQDSVEKQPLASHSAIEDTCVYYHRQKMRNSEGQLCINYQKYSWQRQTPNISQHNLMRTPPLPCNSLLLDD